MNMSYCRFQNTVIDLADCLRALEEIDFNISELSKDEAKAACRLIAEVTGAPHHETNKE